MAYHFEPDISLRANLRGIAEDQIDRALAALEDKTDLEVRVHDLRKRMKKLRALLRLVRPGLGDRYGAENRAFRNIARLFSGLRDSQVAAKTLDGLAQKAGDDGLAPLIAWAARRRDAELAGPDLPGRIGKAVQRLRAARRRVPDWPIEGEDRAALRRGLKTEYGRARKCWREARKAPEDTALLHDWRKRVKYHWYHCRLLREARPETMAARIETLGTLSEALGDDHDLVVLRNLLGSDAAAGLPGGALRQAADLAAGQSQALRRHAFALAPRVLGDKKGDLADRLTGDWLSAPARVC